MGFCDVFGLNWFNLRPWQDYDSYYELTDSDTIIRQYDSMKMVCDNTEDENFNVLKVVKITIKMRRPIVILKLER
jgi:hypothetical protein